VIYRRQLRSVPRRGSRNETEKTIRQRLAHQGLYVRLRIVTLRNSPKMED